MKYLFSPLKDKIDICALPCNILYLFKVVISLSKVIFQNFFEIFQKSVLDILDIVVSEYVIRLMKFSLNILEKCV